MATKSFTSKYAFTYGAALDDDSLYLAGVVRELEDQDFHHTIFWERLDGHWKRYQWRNRSYGLVAYAGDAEGTAVYLGYEGTLKVRGSVAGSSEEILEGGDDGPSSLRTVSSIRVVGDQLYVCGMRRMVYCRALTSKTWQRFDDGLRLPRADLVIAGLYSIDGHGPLDLHAVGIGGEVWQHSARDGWKSVDSPTNLTLLALRCLPGGRVVAGGEQGVLLIGDHGTWAEVAHAFSNETFNCIEWWDERCFVACESGLVYELNLGGAPALTPFVIDALPSVSWITATTKRVWFIGDNAAVSLGGEGWRDESPPAALMA